MNHPFDGFVDGAIASGGDDQAGAAFDVFPRDRPGGPRPGGRGCGDAVSPAVQNLDRLPDQRGGVALELSGARIIDEYRVSLLFYG